MCIGDDYSIRYVIFDITITLSKLKICKGVTFMGARRMIEKQLRDMAFLPVDKVHIAATYLAVRVSVDHFT